MPTLTERAYQRCEANILRYTPAWKQLEIRLTPDEVELGNSLMAWIEANKAHLNTLLVQIGDGLSPDIDAGWPEYGAPKSAETDSPYLFETSLLEDEREPNETLDQVHERLVREYRDLQLRRPLAGRDAERDAHLQSRLYRYKGMQDA